MRLAWHREQREAEITKGTIDVAQVKAEVSVLITEIVRNLDRIQAEVERLENADEEGEES